MAATARVPTEGEKPSPSRFLFHLYVGQVVVFYGSGGAGGGAEEDDPAVNVLFPLGAEDFAGDAQLGEVVGFRKGLEVSEGMGVAASAVENVSVGLVVDLDGEGEEAVGAEGGGGGGEGGGQVADVDEDVGGDDDVELAGEGLHGGGEVGYKQLIVDLTLAGLVDHPGGEVYAGEGGGELAEGAAEEAGAAAEVEDVELAVGGGGGDGFVHELWGAVLQGAGQVHVERWGVVVEEEFDVVGRGGGWGVFLGDGGEVIAGFLRIGSAAECLAVGFGGFGLVVEAFVEGGQVAVGFVVVGAEFEGAAAAFDGVGVGALHAEREGEIAVGVGVVGFEFEGFLVGGDGVADEGFGHQGCAEIVVGFGEVGLERDGFAVEFDGFVHVAAFLEDHAEVVVGVGEVGLERDGLAVGFFGQVELVEGAAGFAEVVVIAGEGGVGSDSEGDEFDGFVMVVVLLGDDAEQVEGVGVVGFELENFVVDGLSLVEAAGGVVVEGGVDEIGDGWVVGGGIHSALWGGIIRKRRRNSPMGDGAMHGSVPWGDG